MLRPRIIFQDAGRVQDFVYFLSNLGEKRPVCGFKKAARRSQPARRRHGKQGKPQKELPQNACAKRIMQKTSLKRKRETLLLRLVVLLGSVFCADGC